MIEREKSLANGFTFTEMLVVVLVIAVLSAIAYPLYTRTATKARAVEAINLLEMVRNKQLLKFARDKKYYSNVDGLGQLTSYSSQESIGKEQLNIKDYTISLNSVKNCATATYSKGRTNFSFSSGYETAGLGCTGDICASFGNIIGTAQEVCNCGSKTCQNGFTLNQNTCECQCLLGCEAGGTCFAPYGGGSTRPCASGCGTQSSSSSCSGAVWSGACSTPSQTQPTTRPCGSGGTQSRTCTPNCSGGTCSAWGACTGQSCPSSTKPAENEPCGNCGTRTRTVTCNTSTGTWTSGTWSACTGGGVCAPNATQSCNGTGTQTCTSSCTWGSCNVTNCPAASKPTESQSCGHCNTGTQTRTVTCNTTNGTWTTGVWGNCQVSGDDCLPGSTLSCTGGKKTCSSSCQWGPCDMTLCPEATKPATTQPCGNCNKGTQTREVYCDSSTGQWSAPTSWSACTGGGVCAPNATQSCNGTGTQTCSATCTWGTCSGTCTLSTWTKVSSSGTTTCGSNPVAGCIEYALCSDIHKPCDTNLKPITTVVKIADGCVLDGGMLRGCGCGGVEYDPDKVCVAVSPNCPSRNICDSLGRTGWCISKILSSECGHYDTQITVSDYSPGCDARCIEAFFSCSAGSAEIEKITCIESPAPTYYRRTCN